MEINSFNKVITLFLMLMLFVGSSEEKKSTDCISKCLISCAKGDRDSPLIYCFYDCLKGCEATLRHPPPINYCDLDCVTETCLDPYTDAKTAKTCARGCSNICKQPGKPH
ncbi:uncharacterized protein LOC130137548 [Syzygium oleosum]|uniref:uncharacterized protein LOC130137548 n=1 Tax=Syzygium oleosum TaxID=219896 RepID=UPI0024BACFBF|nr:uncharacterized protein LOC130137548 [Syzygium oleosum]